MVTLFISYLLIFQFLFHGLAPLFEPGQAQGVGSRKAGTPGSDDNNFLCGHGFSWYFGNDYSGWDIYQGIYYGSNDSISSWRVNRLSSWEGKGERSLRIFWLRSCLGPGMVYWYYCGIVKRMYFFHKIGYFQTPSWFSSTIVLILIRTRQRLSLYRNSI